MSDIVHKSAEVKHADARSYDANAAEFAVRTDFLREQGLQPGRDHAAHAHLGDVGDMLGSVGWHGH